MFKKIVILIIFISLFSAFKYKGTDLQYFEIKNAKTLPIMVCDKNIIRSVILRKGNDFLFIYYTGTISALDLCNYLKSYSLSTIFYGITLPNSIKKYYSIPDKKGNGRKFNVYCYDDFYNKDNIKPVYKRIVK